MMTPAHREEIVGVVVIDGRLFAQPSVDGIGIGVDLDAVLVVIDVTHEVPPGL